MTSTSSPRILVVEDNSETQVLLRHQLGDDYDLTVTSGVDEALEAVEQGAVEEKAASGRPFDAYLLDINLGEERSGTDLLRLLREQEESYTPAIALTAYAMPEDEEYFLSEGFDYYLGKPFAHQELKEALEQVLSGS